MKRRRRLLYSTVVVTTLAAGSLVATGATATAGALHRHSQRQLAPCATPGAGPLQRHSRRQQLTPQVCVGYADSFRNGAPSHPTPWRGSTGAIFKGCNYHHPTRCPKTSGGKDRYDSGAILIHNQESVSMTITHTTVVVGSCTFHPWKGLNVTLASGGNLILTQTGGTPPCHTTHSTYNFDSSQVNHSCTHASTVPQVHITVDGTPETFFDFGQVLNTGGSDIGARACGHHNETHDWQRIFQDL